MIPNDNEYECPEESHSDSGSSDGNLNKSPSAPDINGGCGRGGRRGVGTGKGRGCRDYGRAGGQKEGGLRWRWWWERLRQK